MFFLAQMHPFLGHLPLVIFLLLFLLNWKRWTVLGRGCMFMLLLSTLASGFLFWLSSPLASYHQTNHPSQRIFLIHALCALLCALLLSLALLAKKQEKKRWVPTILFILGALLTGPVVKRGPLYFSQMKVGPLSAVSDNLYQKKVAPIFERRCVSCHGERHEINLSSAQAVSLLQLGNKIIVPFAKEKSTLYKSLLYPLHHPKHMPLYHGRLLDHEIQSIGEWIDQGGFSESVLSSLKKKSGHHDFLWDDFSAPLLPKALAPSESPIDWWLAQSLEKKNLSHWLQYSYEAPPRHLARRLSYDLRGLPPRFLEVQSLENDEAKLSWKKLSEKYLDSWAYAERWAQHWLDLAGHADSSGLDLDYSRPWTFHYRDFVIKALKVDMPFDVFVQRQVAGDVLFNHKEEVATGFLLLAVSKEGTVTEEVRHEGWEQRMLNTFKSTLNVDMSCARCHDHPEGKMYPLTQKNYFSLLAPFSAVEGRIHDSRGFFEGQQKILKSGLREEKRAEAFKKLAPLGYAFTVHAARETFKMSVLRKGRWADVQEEVPFALPNFFGKVRDLEFWKVKVREKIFARNYIRPDEPGMFRAILALWLTDPEHGAGKWLARNIVAWVWQHYFDQDLLEPKALALHQDLLHWLTFDFIQSGWSLKHLQRQIIHSKMYRYSSDQFAQKVAGVKQEQLYLKQKMRRLDTEAVRDSLLLASGHLDPQSFGPCQKPFIEPEMLLKLSQDEWPNYREYPEEKERRALYICRRRGLEYPFFKMVSGPNTSTSTRHRKVETGPLHGLFFLNAKFFSHYADLWAENLFKKNKKNVAALTNEIFTTLLQRAPRVEEKEIVARHLASSTLAPKAALSEVIHSLYASNEFIFLE